ncbi:MAG: hypothetical protein OXP71_11900 [Candidatus Poribacteria bacterium]|nr:hypothetical protein [Candidatus Poribacteria bacterium]
MREKLRQWRNIIIVIGCFFLLGYLQRGLEAIIPDNIDWDWFHQHRIYLFGAITIAIMLIAIIVDGIRRGFSADLLEYVFLSPLILILVIFICWAVTLVINEEEAKESGAVDLIWILIAYFFLIHKLDKLKDAVDSNTGKLVETHEMLNRKLDDIDSSIRARNFYEGG